MDTNNVKAVTINLWVRASTKDYVASGTLHPKKGGMLQFTRHILPSKVAQVLALLDVEAPPVPPKPSIRKKN